MQHVVRPVTSHLLPFGPFMLDSANHILFCPNGKQLRPMETRLLSYLVVNRSVIVKRVDLMRHVWGTEYFDDTRTLDAHIRQLRKHLKNTSWFADHHGAGAWLSVEGLVPNTTPIPYAVQPRWESSPSLVKILKKLPSVFDLQGRFDQRHVVLLPGERHHIAHIYMLVGDQVGDVAYQPGSVEGINIDLHWIDFVGKGGCPLHFDKALLIACHHDMCHIGQSVL